jgi:transcriptional regulator with XRE-family HTH domain
MTDKPQDLFRKGRLRLGWTTTEVAHKLGVTGSAINYWENGKCWPNDRNLDALCILYSLDYEYVQSLGPQRTPSASNGVDRDDRGRWAKAKVTSS